MEKEAYRQHFELEENHWWFRGRKKVIQHLLSPVLNGDRRKRSGPLSILDVGCGTGGMLSFFRTFGEVWGVDLSPEALAYCRRRGHAGRLVQGNALHLPFPNEQFDLVTACNFLYHQWVQDDLKALKELYRVCKKGGYLLLTDSAFECLKSSHDRFFQGTRRYRIKTLRPKIEMSGFSIRRLSYMNMSFFPFIYLWRKFQGNATGSDLRFLPSFLNRFLTSLCIWEAKILRRWNLPFGISIICLAGKPPSDF